MLEALYERTRIMEEQRLVMENDLKNLGRMELLQVLLRVTESNEALMAENAELKSASAMQISRSAKVGSIAEAALQANGFFEAAQRSADDYLREIKKLRDEMIERNRVQEARQATRGASEEEQLEQSQLFERIQDQAKTYIQDVQTYANNVMARASSQAQGIIDDARMRSDEIIAQANSQAQIIIEEAEARVAREESSKAEDLPAEEPVDVGLAEVAPLAESLPEVGLAEAKPSADAPMAEQADAEMPEGEVSESSSEEAAMPEEAIIADESSSEEPAMEKHPVGEPQATASQSTAPLNIDVIVSDIAAAAFTEEGLDPGSTGALVRRGRHVKLPEGMAI